MNKVIVPCLLAVALAGCASTPAGDAEMERRVTYACDRIGELAVVYAGEVARIERADGEPITLQQQPTGSGFAYGSATHTLRGKGQELTYTIGRMVPMQCREK